MKKNGEDIREYLLQDSQILLRALDKNSIYRFETATDDRAVTLKNILQRHICEEENNYGFLYYWS